MKKIIIFLFICAMLYYIYGIDSVSKLSAIFNLGEVTYYSNERPSDENFQCVSCGNNYLCFPLSKKLNDENLSGVYAESYSFKAVDLCEILYSINFKKKTESVFEEFVLYSGICSYKKYHSVNVDGEIINAQIAVYDNKIIVGFPLIVGSF